MSQLQTWSFGDAPALLSQTDDPARIAATLGAEGVRFERWPVRPIRGDALTTYADEVDALRAEGGYTTADVVALTPDHPEREAIRRTFLDEHTHAEDEVRYFVSGRGLFFLHLGDRVHRILCEAGDLLSVPAGTPHWFDTGPEPELVAIRLFTDPSGWVANYVGSDAAERYPLLERA
jgi:1,2-dihydroxy-3-keto-5-methylthiopentene dioxygenase